ncbi:hypothetical protein SZ64_11550 [Erythrobacter sp. SG61-1L]|uniref:HEAT repeat domain-containing protein n=1 Tax=Erythrobacter sp. SG61-1L TaxID=1603897 RepID=UPI0006C8FA07|nr:HEAT repeat domain-containing protein [Erythrobacter sp. SG61-1L]KPL68674.1 hypothetical protein SZ64_11550 [Erythrobacter sp. SG61-1L]
MPIIVIDITLAFFLAASIVLAILTFRRWLSEKDRATRTELRRRIAQAYVGRLEVSTLPPEIIQASPQVRLEAVSHLLQLLRGSERDKLLQIADEERLFDTALHFAESPRAARRSEAIRTLDQFGSPRCVSALQMLMANDEENEIRLEAAAALARLGRLPSAKDTISMLGLRHGQVIRLHRALFRSIAAQHPEQIRELLHEDVQPDLRAVLIDAVAYGGDLRDVAELERAAREPVAEIRAAAVRAARLVGDPRTEPWVIAALSDEAEIVRIQAVQSVAKLGFKSALPKLRELQDDASVWVRVRTGDAMALLAPQAPAGEAG